jgi:hypothetical protein
MAQCQGRHTCRVLYTCCVLCTILVHHCCATEATSHESKDPVLRLVGKYGDGNTIDHKGLEKLLGDLGIHIDGNWIYQLAAVLSIIL